jgi:23S rRNA (pseudouridine1915-N3)-methyltransferase
VDLLVVAVGRSRDPLADALFAEYARRSTWPIRLVEVQPRRPVAAERRKEAEAELLLAAVPPGAVLVALDEHGRDETSEAFASRLGSWRDEGRRTAAFLIGGPDGLAPRVLATATLSLAFGRMTWPHRLVRPMLAEQLYRATAILAGHPYHRG